MCGHEVSSLPHLPQRLYWLLPGCDEVLSQSDADWCACDGHMTFGRTLCLIPDLDVRSRHLPNLTDLAPLAANDAANQLRGTKKNRL